MGKSADTMVGLNYPTGGGNDIGVYKQPQPNTDTQPESIISKSGNGMADLDMSVGNTSKGNVKGMNPYGTGEMRGYGAATKGRKISGKMG
jgi:hypothetical protein